MNKKCSRKEEEIYSNLKINNLLQCKQSTSNDIQAKQKTKVTAGVKNADRIGQQKEKIVREKKKGRRRGTGKKKYIIFGIREAQILGRTSRKERPGKRSSIGQQCTEVI